LPTEKKLKLPSNAKTLRFQGFIHFKHPEVKRIGLPSETRDCLEWNERKWAFELMMELGVLGVMGVEDDAKNGIVSTALLPGRNGIS
jgi:hypothetical protein